MAIVTSTLQKDVKGTCNKDMLLGNFSILDLLLLVDWPDEFFKLQGRRISYLWIYRRSSSLSDDKLIAFVLSEKEI